MGAYYKYSGVTLLKKALVYLLLLVIMIGFVPLNAYAEGEDSERGALEGVEATVEESEEESVSATDFLPESITTVEQLYVWIDYLCIEGRYGHNNDLSDVTSLDCMGTANLIYSKMGKGINWNNIESTGKKVTKLSDAKIGDLVVYINPNEDSKYYNDVSHVAIYLGDGELFQAASAKDNMVTQNRLNTKSWSNIKKFKCKWSGDYASWCWGDGNESEHPDNIFIIHVVDLGSDPSSVAGIDLVRALIE